MKVLKTTERRKKDLTKQFYVLDIETKKYNGKQGARPENFAMGVLYGKDFSKVFFDREEMVKYIFENCKNKYVFCHFAEFDFNILFGNLYYLDQNAIFNGKFITARCNGVIFADSLNIFPTSVKKLGDQIGLKKLELPKKFLTGKVKAISKKDIIYCTRDCEIVFKALSEIFNLIGNIKVTIASASMEFFRNTYLKHPIYYNDELTQEFFKSYYGGRNEVFKLGKTESKILDINSMYPFAMKNAIFPNPEYLIKVTPNNMKGYTFNYILNKYEGLISCKIKHKDHYFGFLPYKIKEKLVFPVGEFEGIWNLNELRFAIKNKIIEVESFEYIIFSKRNMKSPFVEFVNDNYEKKKNYTGIYKLIFKLILNSLYGKFAEKSHGKLTYYKEFPVRLMEQYRLMNVDFKLIVFNEQRNDCFIEVNKKSDKERINSIPLFSSYITSYSRIILLKGLLNYYDKGVITYCDTDSILIENLKNIPNSAELGEFKLEDGTVTNIEGLKHYQYYLQDGHLKEKLKGVPKSAIKLNDGGYMYDKFIKTKEGIRRKIEPGTIVTVKKYNRHKYDKREIFADGSTKPLKINYICS